MDTAQTAIKNIAKHPHLRPLRPLPPLRHALALGLAALMAACSTPPPPAPTAPSPPSKTAPSTPLVTAPLGKSRWTPVAWAELPGFDSDSLHEAWNAWLKSCERPPGALAPLCTDVRRLSIATEGEQRGWLMARLQPYRVESGDGNAQGLLTAYYEPLLDAARQPGNGFEVPIYRLPAGGLARKPWYTREQIETLPEAQAALSGRAIAWVRDPIDALVLHIQGSGRLRIQEADGSARLIRVSFAGTNEQPYQSVGRWLLDQGAIKDASWPGIKAWLAANPERQQALLWSNPRYVFFQEEALNALDASFGPRGAQGVALTPGRSIAVDRSSIPYGTPVWLSSSGPQVQLNRLVMAQDTGSAIVGAVRADYFAGWGDEAGDFAGRLKQSLRLWVLWPRLLAPPQGVRP